MTQEYTLRAMATNYRNGHIWDHLDGDTVTKAADEIKRMREEYKEVVDLLKLMKDNHGLMTHGQWDQINGILK